MLEFRYLVKYYARNKLALFVSVLCLTICYLTVNIVFSFASAIETKAQDTFNEYFGDAKFILSPKSGIHLSEEGQLYFGRSLDNIIVDSFQRKYPSSAIRSIKDNEGNVHFLVFSEAVHLDGLRSLANRMHVKWQSGFTIGKDSVEFVAILYDVEGKTNRFSFFSFQNQLTAFVLGEQLSDSLGLISRILFVLAVLFSLHISSLYYRERQSEFTTLALEGFTDRSFRIILIDCVLQNAIAFLLSVLLLIVIVSKAFINGSGKENLQGLVYIIPYLPVMVILQLIVLFNGVIGYGANIK